MHVLVTGGAGFIGSHLVEALLNEGHDVAVVDDLSGGRRENVPPEAKLHVVSVTSPEVEAIIRTHRPQAVFHLAAQMDVRRSVADPILDADINVSGTVRVAGAAAASGCHLMVFASTGGAIYGEQDVFPAPEGHPQKPESPYGLSKMCAEKYLDYFSRTSDMRTVCLRYSNVYGPRQDPHGEAGVVAIFSQKILSNEAPTIYGDGKQTRDYVFVKDVVRANMRAFKNANVSGVFNVGTGIETDVNQLAEAMCRVAGRQPDIIYAPKRPGEQMRSCIDAGLALKTFGWAPKTVLADGLKQTIDWFASKERRAA